MKKKLSDKEIKQKILDADIVEVTPEAAQGMIDALDNIEHAEPIKDVDLTVAADCRWFLENVTIDGRAYRTPEGLALLSDSEVIEHAAKLFDRFCGADTLGELIDIDFKSKVDSSDQGGRHGSSSYVH